jgi:hypothetical protein
MYWYGRNNPDRPDTAWVFYAFDGYQGGLKYGAPGGINPNALAVHSGRIDITTAPVPEPSTILLIGLG